MIYLIQETTQASPWTGAILSAGVVAAVVGLVGVLAGQFLTGLRHSRDLRLTEQGQITERFTRAIEQLGSEKLEIKLGGIYALERIASDSPERDYSTIIEVLTAYVRENARWSPGETPALSGESDEDNETPSKSEKQEPQNLPADIQAILTVLGRRKKAADLDHLRSSDELRLDLRATDLRRADLTDANLQLADLRGANLQEAKLWGANLQRALLGEGANLQGADLWLANLQRAQLGPAKLESFRPANLQGAKLLQTNLQDALLRGVNLQEVHLGGANLQGAVLEEANLQGATLRYTDLRDTEGLTYDQINEANGEENTKLPDHLQRPAHWSKGEEESEES